MASFRQLLPRRRRSRAAALVVVVTLIVAAGWWATRPQPVPDAPLLSATQVAAEQRAAEARAAAAQTTPTQATPSPAAGADPPAGDGPPAARVPDVPLAWTRIAAQAASWPAATAAPVIGKEESLPTAPASRVRDTIGLNIDLWRTEFGYRDFGPVVDKVSELHLRHARVTMLAGPTYGLSRMQELGRAGVRLDVEMGDAFGRYSMAPYPTLEQRLKASVLPYVDSVEGTNEPDNAKQADWAQPSRSLQRKIVAGVSAVRGNPVAVVAPALSHQVNYPELGSFAGLADASNAHAYSNGAEPSAPLDEWKTAVQAELPGAPMVVTEAGFQDDVSNRRYQLPLPNGIAADYIPRLILEAIRRGIPRVYIYEMINRWNDPFHIDAGAHFGLLDEKLRPKPAWTSLVRLQNALLDRGRPDAEVRPLKATVVEGPKDLRLMAFRRKDGTASLAVWRAVSEWNTQTGVATPVGDKTIKIDLGSSIAGLRITNLTTGGDLRMLTNNGGNGNILTLKLAGSAVVVNGIH